MKRVLIILSTLVFTGCAVLDAYLMAPYDANEYLLITQIRVDAGQFKKQCDNPILAPVNAQTIAARTELFDHYEQYIPRNDNGIKASRALNEIAQGLNTAYGRGPVSPVFCRLKYNNLEQAAELVQRITAGRPRR
jgi:hypothetical protein